MSLPKRRNILVHILTRNTAAYAEIIYKYHFDNSQSQSISVFVIDASILYIVVSEALHTYDGGVVLTYRWSAAVCHPTISYTHYLQNRLSINTDKKKYFLTYMYIASMK